MNPDESDLTQFFKALADGTRLKMVGLLARESLTGEQLAAMLAVKPATISHHLARLAEAGLVEAEGLRGREKPYRLRLAVIHSLAQLLLARETLPQTAADVDVEAFDRKVVRDFSRRDGSLKEIPAQRKKLLAVLRHIVRRFEPGREYNEKHINFILAQFHPDIASLRRALISDGLLARDPDGGKYWRPAPPANTERDTTMMTQPDPTVTEAVNERELEVFFRTLVDTDRLAIAGRLARQRRTTEQLAAELGMKPAAVARHLATLVGAGLVTAEPHSAGTRYSLRWEAPRALAGRLAQRPPAPEVPELGDAFDETVVRNTLTAEGRLRDLPLQEKKLRAVVRFVARAFEPGRTYTEKEVNAILARYHPDTSALRRHLVDFGWLTRTPTGSAYWLLSPTAS